MSVNVYTGGKLKKISGENITSQKILSAIGYQPARADTVENHVNNTTIHVTEEDKAYWNDKNYHTLQGAPNIVEDESATLYIADIEGNVIAQINEDGVYTTDVLLTTNRKSVLSAIEKLETLNYNDLQNKPGIWEENDGSAEFIIADREGRIILKVDAGGLTVKKINGTDFSNFVQSIETFVASIHPVAFSGEYDDLKNAPIIREPNVTEGTDTFKIIDDDGNIALEIDANATKVANLNAKAINLNEKNLETEINLKAKQSDLEALSTAFINHKNNEDEDIYHVTAAEKQSWNDKSNFSGKYDDLIDKPIIREPSENNVTFKVVDKDNNIALQIDSESTKVAKLEVNDYLKINGTDIGSSIQNITNNFDNYYNKTDADAKYEPIGAEGKSNTYTESQISNLIGNATEEYQTLEAIEGSVINSFQNIEKVFSEHRNNKDKNDNDENIYHVTDEEKAYWNDKSFSSITNSPIIEDDQKTFKIVDSLNNIALEVKEDGIVRVGELAIKEQSIATLLNNKVDKVEGFGLSENNFTNEEKRKLTAINKIENNEVEVLVGERVSVDITEEGISTNKITINELSFGNYIITKNNNGLVWVWEGEE